MPCDYGTRIMLLLFVGIAYNDGQAIMTGGTVTRITIDPNLGGCTLVDGGHPLTILSAGYIGSTFFGGIFVLASWDTLVAKICSKSHHSSRVITYLASFCVILGFIIAFGLLCPLALVRDKL